MSMQGRVTLTQHLQQHWPLAGVILIYLILAAVYGFMTPPFEGPDEPQHFAYVVWLAEGKGFPPQGEAAWDTPLEQEAGQTPLYYLAASLPARLIDLAAAPLVYEPNPYFPGYAIGNDYDSDNRALHHVTVPWPPRGEALALAAARAVTMLFGALLIAGVYLLALQVGPQTPAFAAGAAALVALTPQVLFLSSVVSNDIPAAAFSTLTLLFLARLIRQGPAANGWTAAAAGLLAGLAALTKINALLLVVPAAVALLWLWLSGRKTLGQTAVLAALLAAGLLLVTGWWFWRVARLYGSPLGTGTHDYAPWTIGDPQSLSNPFARWLEVGRYYWITLGWGTIRPPAWVYTLLFVFALLAVIGLAAVAYRRLRAGNWSSGPAAAVLLMLAAALLANAVLLEVWMNRVVAPYGRLLFPSIGAITVFLMLGWRAIQRRFALLPLLFLAVLAVATPFLLLKPAYSAPLLTAQEIDTLPAAAGWRFGTAAEPPLLELLSVEPQDHVVESGSALAARVCWRILESGGRRPVVLLHLVGPQNRVVGQRLVTAGRGLLPDSQWQSGPVFCDMLHVGLEGQGVPPLVYRLEVGLLDGGTLDRLPAVDAQGSPLAATFIDQIRVASPATEHVPISDAGGAPVQLVSTSFDPSPWRPDGSYAYELRWAAMAPLAADYQVFLHLRDRNTGAVVAQADHAPLDGWYPTSWWPAGEVIRDAGRFALPADMAAGSYDLVAGFYDLATLQPLGAAFELGTVEVRP